MFKKLVVTSLAMMSVLLHAAELTNYKAIEDTLAQGKLITFVLNANSCNVNNPNPVPIKTKFIVFRPKTVLVSNADYLAATGTWFTSALRSNTGNGVNEIYKIKLDIANQAKITWEFFDADTGMRSSIKTIEAACELGKGIKVYEN